MNTTDFIPVQTVTAEGQITYHDGSTSYFDWLTKFEQRKNEEYLNRQEMQEREERLQRAFAENLRPKRVKNVKKSAKLSGVMGW